MGRRRYATAEEIEEAEEYLRRYLATAEPRLAWLREESARTGGPTPDQLDYSRDSLVPLWEWAIGQFRLRPADAPLDFVDLGRQGRYYRPHDADLPMWFGRRAVQAPDGWSDETLALIDGLIYYLAETVLRAVPGAKWEVWHADVKNHIDENQPVLTGFHTHVDLFMPMMNLAGQVGWMVKPDRPNPYRIPPPTPFDLRDWFDAIVADAT